MEWSDSASANGCDDTSGCASSFFIHFFSYFTFSIFPFFHFFTFSLFYFFTSSLLWSNRTLSPCQLSSLPLWGSGGEVEYLGHAHLVPVRHQPVGMRPHSFDERENVIPPSTVEPCRVLAQLVQKLVHLEGRIWGDGLL